MTVAFGYTILFVESVVEAVRFYERAFGFADSFVHESEDYGELSTGATKLAFTAHELAAQVVPFRYRRADEGELRPGVEVTLTTADVDGAYRRAVDAGATPLAESGSGGGLCANVVFGSSVRW